MKRKRNIWLSACILLAFACLAIQCQKASVSQTGPETDFQYKITGILPDSLNGAVVYMRALRVFDRIGVDTTTVRDGKFTLEGTYGAPAVGSLRFERNGRLFDEVRFALESAPVELTFDGQAFHVTGGRRTMAVRECEAIDEHKDSVWRSYGGSRKLLQEKNDEATSETRKAEIQALMDKISGEYQEAIRDFINRNKDNVVGAYAYLVNSSMFNSEEKEALESTAGEEFLNDKGVKRVIASRNGEIGRKYTDFAIEDSAGNNYMLSDFVGKDKYVLVEFWASYCEGCRLDIPKLKEMYAKYKDRGVEFMSVTVDYKREAWLKAMREEDMPWGQYNDLNNACGELYGRISVPFSMLISPDGTIVETELRSRNVDEKLGRFLTAE